MNRKPFIVCALSFLVLCTVAASCVTAAEFDWQRFKGEELHVLALKFMYNSLTAERISEFEKLTGMKVAFDQYPYKAYLQKTLVEFGGSSTRTDVYNIGPTSMGKKYVNAGWCESLDKYVNDPELTNPDWDPDDFIESVWDANVMDGIRVGIPLNAVTWILYYRKDLFARKGLVVPQTMAELELNAQKLTYDNHLGWVSRGNRLQSVPIWGIFLHAFGGSWLDENRNPAIDSPEAIESCKFYAHLQQDYSNEGAAQNSHWEAVSLVQQGQAAQYIDTCTYIGLVEDPEKSTVLGKMGYGRIPSGPGGRVAELWCWSFGISPFSQKKDAAWYFIQWASSKEMQGWIQTHKFPSARKSIWAQPAYTEAWPEDWLKSVIKSFKVAAPICHPSVVEMNQIEDVIGEALVNVELGYDTPEDALRRAAAEMKTIMGATE